MKDKSSVAGNLCAFCQIISRERQAEVLYKDTHSLAFLDQFRQPFTGGHVLIIPQEHFEDVYAISDEVGFSLIYAIKINARAVKDVTGCSGVKLWASSGRDGSRSVPHLHFHILPHSTKAALLRYYVRVAILRRKPSTARLTEVANLLRVRIKELVRYCE
jgi:histidine triad (HIT) family protein